MLGIQDHQTVPTRAGQAKERVSFGDSCAFAGGVTDNNAEKGLKLLVSGTLQSR